MLEGGEKKSDKVKGLLEKPAQAERGDFIPSRETCLELMERYGMLPHIREHSRQVTRVALFLAESLKPRFPQLNLALIEAAAMLHDIAKTETIRQPGNHAQMGEDLLRELGYTSVARIVGQHVRLDGTYFSGGPVDEVVVVHYADKRVNHERIVGLAERFTYLIRTYGRTPEAVDRIQALYQDTLKIEAMIFRHLTFSPEGLKKMMNEE